MERKMLSIGDKFPEVEVVSTHGSLKLPDAYSGMWFVFFSYPADFAPIGATELVSFQVKCDDFKKLDCELIGLCVSQVFSHLKWVEWIRNNLDVEIQFSLIADTGMVSDLLGLIRSDRWVSTVRAAFVVGPKGNIRAILYYPQELGRNVDEILRMVKAIQISDRHGVAIPANWPNNELIKDEVILPPPQDEKAAKERVERCECLDWWFCHKKLEEV